MFSRGVTLVVTVVVAENSLPNISVVLNTDSEYVTLCGKSDFVGVIKLGILR